MSALSPAQLRQFEQEGYLVVDGVLDPARDVGPVLDEYQEVLDRVATTLVAQGQIAETYAGLPFPERLLQISAESQQVLAQHFDFSMPLKGVREDTPIHLGPAIFGTLTNPRLLDVVQSVVGQDIYSNPVQHIRLKMPKRARMGLTYHSLISKVPWHQDNGVVLPEADESHILTVWAPITEATIENGCPMVIPRSHRGDIYSHCPSDKAGVAIPERLLPTEGAIPMPMRPGSVLLMHQRTVHSSLDNTTDDQVRISFDLRYQPVGEPTGRPQFPGFVARSQSHPEWTLRDPEAWANLWREARSAMATGEAPRFNRWDPNALVCA